MNRPLTLLRDSYNEKDVVQIHRPAGGSQPAAEKMAEKTGKPMVLSPSLSLSLNSFWSSQADEEMRTTCGSEHVPSESTDPTYTCVPVTRHRVFLDP